MLKNLKPMLGTSIPRESLIAQFKIRKFLASVKLDGVRALVRNRIVLSRSLKPIPNAFVQRLFGRDEYEGLDGELIVGPANAPDVFRATTSGVMSPEGQPDVQYHTFDLWNEPNMPFHQRVATLARMVSKYTDDVVAVAQTQVASIDEVDDLFDQTLARGFEGLVLRNPLSLYKFGRSTIAEAGLLKMKPFVDAEAVVIGVVEQMHNANTAFKNELGRTARSSAKAGKVGMKVLGALVCRTPEGVEFEIGTGFSAAEREAYWMDPHLIGRTVKYKSLIIGVKDKPRSAVFLGFRDRRDT